MKHSLNPVVTPILPTLNALRGQIDAIDDAILDLLEQRYAATRLVAPAKADVGSKSLPIRPQRERAILERLSARATQVPPSDIAHIWQASLALSARFARSTGVHPGGLHLEVTPARAVECVDRLSQAYAPRCFENRCDPRLNAAQAMHVVKSFADAIEHVR